jgi:hypothetical membrane protein
MTTITDQKTGGKKAGIIFLEGVYILMLLAMFILPLFMGPDHSIIRNTLSDLGAQNSAGAWIINSILIALAFSSVISGWGFFKSFVFHRVILVLFGVSIVLSAFFNNAPVNPEIHYNINEDGWHKYFACITWITYVILAFSTALILKKQTDRSLALIAGISAVLLSLLSSEAEQTAGIWQRLLFIISFGWLIYTLKTTL